MAAARSSTPPVSGETIERALAQGVLTAQQAEMLRYLENNRPAQSGEPVDDEKFRFINGFGDIFVTIGIALFLGALTYFAAIRFEGGGAGLAVALASWLLAEYFTRKRRMALPSIVLLLVYAAAVFLAVVLFISGSDELSLAALETQNGPVVIAGVVTIAATAAHYWRFGIPITFAAGVAALVASVLALVFGAAPDLAGQFARPILFVCGLGVFALAMRFDLSDQKRQTRRTDIAFWLHMLAAPMVVHPLVSGLIGSGGLTTGAAAGVLAIFAGLAIVAVLVDRRAVLVSGLAYAGVAFGSLITQIGFSEGVVPLTMLVLGTLVLLLSAGWHGLRRRLLGLFPSSLVSRLPSHT